MLTFSSPAPWRVTALGDRIFEEGRERKAVRVRLVHSDPCPCKKRRDHKETAEACGHGKMTM